MRLTGVTVFALVVIVGVHSDMYEVPTKSCHDHPAVMSTIKSVQIEECSPFPPCMLHVPNSYRMIITFTPTVDITTANSRMLGYIRNRLVSFYMKGQEDMCDHLYTHNWTRSGCGIAAGTETTFVMEFQTSAYMPAMGLIARTELHHIAESVPLDQRDSMLFCFTVPVKINKS